ncbi:hypothetical protein [Thermococcus henrietii]|uniref:hypothetical protein n=1 Tax=Thermococcus henrietii TaxID=2016361 RepID=UPI000C08D93A|nr:hypothetical protein [Thermococcus henrietii]
MTWLEAQAPNFSKWKRLVDLSRVAALDVIENEKNAVIGLRSANDTELAKLIVEKEKLQETIDALTLLIEQSKQFSDAKVLTLEEVLQTSTRQGVWA